MLKLSKSLLLIFIYLLGMLIVPLFFIFAAVLLSGSFSTAMYEEALLRYSTFGMIGGYAFLTVTLFILTKQILFNDFKQITSWSKFTKQMFLGILASFSATMLGSILMQLLGIPYTPANQEAVESALIAVPLGMVFSVVLFAPIVEEIIFRMVLMKTWRFPAWFGIVFSSFIFGLVHVMSGGLVFIIPYFLMGLVFGYIYHKNDNIWYPIILHMLHNGLSVIMLFAGQGMS